MVPSVDVFVAADAVIASTVENATTLGIKPLVQFEQKEKV